MVDIEKSKSGRCRPSIRKRGAVYQLDGVSGETHPGYVLCAIILMALSRTDGQGLG